MEVFWQKGYEGASLDDLTAAMGLNRPSVYAAFGDKRALFLAALDRYVATVGRMPLEAMGKERDAVRGLRAFLSATIDLAVRGATPKGCLIACVASEVAACDPAARDRVSRAISGTQHALSAYLRERLTIDDQEAEALAVLLTALMHSLAIRARAGTSRDKLEQAAEATVNLLARRITHAA
jgi:AcrR family transcriptional regulator